MKDRESFSSIMPGSLLITNDALSDRSDVSTRSLDSKIGGKKVSFNKAVRVKQYPWTPEVSEPQNGDHFTLPNNRFWFKVYKSKPEPSTFNQWSPPEVEQDNMECIHDSLAPIAEDEDPEVETDQYQENPSFYDRFGRKISNDTQTVSSGVRSFNGDLRNGMAENRHPNDPPIDYFQDRNGFINNRNLTNTNPKPSWAQTNGERKSLIDKSFPRHEQGSSDLWRRENGINPVRKEWGDTNQVAPANRDISIENIKLPRMFIKSDSTRKQIENRWNATGSPKSHERRSRSHDDILDCENSLRSFRKADKSVSTEDLNYNQDEFSDSSPYRLFKRSRDIATQCYGTLSKSKGPESVTGILSSPSNRASFNSNGMNGETNNVNDSKFTRSSLNQSGLRNSPSNRPTFNSNGMTGETNNVNDSKFTRSSFNQSGLRNYSTSSTRFLNQNGYNQTNDNNHVAPKVNFRALNNLSPPNGKSSNFSNKRNELPPTGKTFSGKKQLTSEYNNTTYDYVDRPAGTSLTKSSFPTRESRSTIQSNAEPLKFRGSIRNQDLKTTASVGYVRGRQIPLTEANPNSLKKLASRNDNRYRNPIPLPKAAKTSTSLSGRTETQQPATKYFSSNFESRKGRNFNFRNNENSTKSSNSGFDDTQSMIDWSLSGFQLATHPENRITSISDSECTVHRRPPLLMYIPGVSHHDRPAIEDDRLSALSDMSRSELNDDISPLVNSRGGDRGIQSDFRRRHSMPRDGKLKWIKWKSNAQR